MRPQLCDALGTAESRLGALVSWHWEAHKPLYQEPGGVQAKGVARKGKLPPAPGPLSVPTAYRVPLVPFTELVSAGPSPGRGSPFLPFQKKGSPRGLRASQSYTYQRRKGERWEPAPPTHSLLSPPPPAGGKVTSGNNLRTLPPKIFRKETSPPGSLRPGGQGRCRYLGAGSAWGPVASSRLPTVWN